MSKYLLNADIMQGHFNNHFDIIMDDELLDNFHSSESTCERF